MAPKWGISTYRDHNLIYSYGDRYTSACQTWGHSSLVCSRKWPEIANLAGFIKSNAATIRNINRRRPISYQFSGYISNFRPFKLTSIKTKVRNQCYFNATTNTMWNDTIDKIAKDTTLQFWPNPELISNKLSRYLHRKCKVAAIKNRMKNWLLTFILHGHETKTKVQN